MHRRWMSLWRVAVLMLMLFVGSSSGALLAQDTQDKQDSPKTSALEKQLVGFGYSTENIKEPLYLHTALAHARAQAGLARESSQSLIKQAARLQGGIDVVSEQLKRTTRMRRRDRRTRVFSITMRALQRGVVRATQDAMDQSAITLDLEAKALASQIEAIRVLAEQDQAKQREEMLKKQREVELRKLNDLAKKKADDEAEQARKDLLKAKKQSADLEAIQRNRLKAAERIKALTDEWPKEKQKYAEELKSKRVLHATLSEELDLLIKRTPLPVKLKKTRAEIDPKFKALRDAYRDAMKLYQSSATEIASLNRKLNTFKDKLEAIESAQANAKANSEVAGAQIELLQARQTLREILARQYKQEIEQLEDKIVHHETLKKLARKQIDSDKVFTSQLLPRLSPEARSDFFDLSNDKNWSDAYLAAELGVDLIIDQVSKRLLQLFSLPSHMTSVAFWYWVLGLLVRVGIIVLLLRFVSKNATQYTKRLTAYLLRKRWFARYPNVAIKFGEVLRHLLLPVLRLASIYVLIAYILPILPEAKYLLLVVKAIFIFQSTTIIVSVIVLPRALRAKQDDDDVFDLDQWNTDADGVDVFKLEIDRARKLVRSAKVIIWFWLLVLYLPMLVVAFMGYSVIWRVVDLAVMWFLVIVIYSVLTTWKSDIARLFERLAADRLPRGVQFVNSNKDRIWGVLVIGLASLYVIGRESARLGREYLLEREWSKRINNFIFRKKIEIQQREQAKKEGDVDYSTQLPDSYTDFFNTSQCLWEESYLIERGSYIQDIINVYNTMGTKHRQGSVALIGETGIGKTTLLNQLVSKMRTQGADKQEEIVYLTIFTKMTGRPGVFRLLRTLFELGPEIKTKAQLIRAIRRKKRKVIVVDDCHHLFLRQIGGFAGLELFLEVVNLTDTFHMWVLSFNRFAWYYLARVRRREHYFGKILAIDPWKEAEVENLISTRNLMSGTKCNFSELVVTHEPAEVDAFSYEVIKSSQGYFRLLHEFSQGNPRVAMTYWLRSLKPQEAEEDEPTLQVTLFRRPEQRISPSLPDNYWFALTAIAQHGSLSAVEMAGVINADQNFCETAMNFFDETDVIQIDGRYRARLRPLYFRQVLKYMVDSNYLYE